MSNTEPTLEQLFDYIKFVPFLKDFTEENINSGIRSRKSGNGTQKNDKQKNFTNADKVVIKQGFNALVAKFQPLIDQIEDGN